MGPTLESFLLALIGGDVEELRRIEHSNIGILFFERKKYIGCETIIDLNTPISSISDEDLLNTYDLLRNANIFQGMTRPITECDKCELMSKLIAYYKENPAASKSDFTAIYDE